MANGDHTALPQGSHFLPREHHLAFDLHDVSFHRSVPISQPMAAKKKEAPGASRMPPAKIEKNLDFCV